MKTFFKILILFFVTSCANMIAPSGGPRDNDSPKVSKTQISFSEIKGEENLIMYEFDERIQDHKFEDNFYISPPLKRITHKIQGSVLEIKIKDSINLFGLVFDGQLTVLVYSHIFEYCFHL